MTFEKLDKIFWKGDIFTYQDMGLANKHGRTHKYKVVSRRRRDSGTHYGHIRWANPSNCMSFYPLVMMLSPADMEEIGEFCKQLTDAHIATTGFHEAVTKARKKKV